MSKPADIDEKIVSSILSSSRKNNSKSEITGALIYGKNVYLQFLEGPTAEVEKTFKKIKADERHTKIQILKSSRTDRRLFRSWTMRDDSIANWMWSEEEIESGAVENLKSDEAYNVFNNLSREIDQFI